MQQEAQWSASHFISREMACPEAYEKVGQEMVHALERQTSYGWVVSGPPVVTEEEDFLRNRIIVTAVVPLKMKEVAR